jgi:hypothetical protein
MGRGDIEGIGKVHPRGQQSEEIQKNVQEDSDEDVEELTSDELDRREWDNWYKGKHPRSKWSE